MTKTSEDLGVIQALLERFEKQRLPWALGLKERVDAGERLSEFDMMMLEEVFGNFHHIEPLIARHPEYHQLVANAISLFNEITAKALENEQKA